MVHLQLFFIINVILYIERQGKFNNLFMYKYILFHEFKLVLLLNVVDRTLCKSGFRISIQFLIPIDLSLSDLKFVSG